MTQRQHIAVIDIGKTNAKLALVDLASLNEVEVITRPNKTLPGPPYPHFNVEGHWAFLLDGLGKFNDPHGVDGISITTHGAAAALLDENGELAAPILDYEFDGPDALWEEYRDFRPPFSETGSPQLAAGLNIGAQLFWQFTSDPGLRDRVEKLVTYPQYWGHRLTGNTATDLTSLGCHTDLWNPYEGKFSALVAKLGLQGKIATSKPSNSILGTLQPKLANKIGLPASTPVYCGIHDSNASLLPHLLRHKAPFSVLSTGTWVVAMSVGGEPVRLDPSLDTLINVNAHGQAVPSARFMGGREHDLALKGKRKTPIPADIRNVLENQIMLLPSLAPETGPFKGFSPSWVGEEPQIGQGTRTAAVDFYLALVAAHCLELIGHDGAVIVEGPFAKNTCFLEMLAAETEAEIIASQQVTGTSQGAALLARKIDLPEPAKSDQIYLTQDRCNRLQHYAQIWKSQ
ncbi:MAG: carbohydrate kinase [Boseongicola sp.]|nr:MAG: carbohydrate kinase [Boseongicola sp.]